MASLTWHLRRLRAMSPAEVGWRARAGVRDVIDRCRLALSLYPALAPAWSSNGRSDPLPPFRVCDVRVGDWVAPGAEADERAWCERVRRQADRIVQHRLSFFDLEDRDLGDPIDWNRDHASGRAAPLRFAASIDYRDCRVTGDAKVVWEPNRHHQLVVLGRAYRATGELRYASAVAEQLDSWLRQCPYGRGMNWRSPLELAVRLINWVWAVDLIRESGLWTGEFRARVLHAVHVHLWEITRKYSRGSSANNHLIGEAAGVFITTSYFQELAGTSRWRETSRSVVEREILAQTYPDGGGREQALGYQLFVLQFFLLAGLVGRHTGREFPDSYWSRLERMLEFVGALVEGGPPPMFGDCDDGYVLDLGSTHGDTRGLLAIGAVLFQRRDFKGLAEGYREPARWLLGRDGRDRHERLEPVPAGESLECRAFPESGYYLLQAGRTGTSDRLSVVFDCGPLGLPPLAAHGHADALAFTLRAFGRDVLVDPGTYDYFSFPAWRDYFRSTPAHNTVAIDGVDQSVMEGPFLWGCSARARCTQWQPQPQGGRVAGEHDGYARLADPVLHRRALELDARSLTLTIRDEIVAEGTHDVSVYFHVAEDCAVSEIGPGRFAIATAGGTVILELDPGLDGLMRRGSEEPIGGWVSRSYHRKAAATTIVGSRRCHGPTSMVCRATVMSDAMR